MPSATFSLPARSLLSPSFNSSHSHFCLPSIFLHSLCSPFSACLTLSLYSYLPSPLPSVLSSRLSVRGLCVSLPAFSTSLHGCLSICLSVCLLSLVSHPSAITSLSVYVTVRYDP